MAISAGGGFASIAAQGINRIYAEDLDTQKHYLDIFAKRVRRMPDASPMLKAQAFFVPNNEYMLEYFGEECADPFLDIYNFDGECVWQNYIVFPIKNVAGTIMGFGGFDPFAKIRRTDPNENSIENYYRYSRSSVFTRGKYLYMLNGVYEKAVKDGYIIIADGFFDMLNLDHAGFNTASALGSNISPEIIFQLKFIDRIFLARDNDKAGLELERALKGKLPQLKTLTQSIVKDSDDILKSEYRDMYIAGVKRAIEQNTDLALRFKPQL